MCPSPAAARRDVVEEPHHPGDGLYGTQQMEVEPAHALDREQYGSALGPAPSVNESGGMAAVAHLARFVSGGTFRQVRDVSVVCSRHGAT